MEQKEIEEFAIRFGGAMTGALESAATEAAFKLGQCPFCYSVHPNLAPLDNLIVGGLAIPPWVIGALMEDDGEKRGDVKAKELGKNVKIFGEGDVIYSWNLVLHHTLIRNIEKTFPLERKVVATRTKTAAQPGQKTDVGHRIIKL